MAYRIYTEVNLADTTRDQDEMFYEEIGYKLDLYEAKLVAKEYIKTRFFHKDTELKKRNNGTYTATDFASYGVTLIIESITIS